MSDGKIEYEVRADLSHLTADLNNANQTVRNSAQQTQRQVDNIGKTAVSAIKPLTDASKEAGESIDELGDTASETSNDINKLGDSERETSEETKGLGDETGKTTKKIKEQGEQSKKSADANGKLKDSVDKMKSSFKDAKDTIGKYAAVAGAALTAVGAAAVKSASEAETSFAKVRTLLSDKIMIDDYYNSIKSASANTGVNFGSMAESVYSAISASIDENKAVDFAQNAVKLAKGGFTETATAVDVLTTAINAYGLATDDATHISDVLITTQNLGKTTVDELSHSMGQTIPIANSAGVAIEELSTAYAVMTKNGVATAEAGTQIKAMLNELNASGTNVDKTLREISGKSFAELKSEGQNTADVLNTLAEYAQKSGQKLSDLFGSVEAGNAALTIVKDGGADFVNILDQMQDSAGATEKAYEIMSNTVEERFNKLKNKFALAMTEIGEDLLPTIEKFADYIDEHFAEISDTIEDIGKSVESVAEFLLKLTKVLWENKEAVGAVVAGYVIFKSAMAIGGLIASVIGAVKSLSGALKAATTAQQAMNAACNANPYVLLASVILGVVTALGTLIAVSGNSSKSIAHLSGEVKGLAENAKTATNEQKQLSDVASEYERINSSVSDVKEKKEQLAGLQKTLNGLYGDEKTGIDLVNGSYEENIRLLKEKNEQERIRRLNQINEDIDAANKKIGEATGYQAFTLDFVASDLSAETREWYDRIKDAKSEYGYNLVELSNDLKSFYISGNIDEMISTLEELENSISSDDATGKLKDFFNSVHDRKAELISMRDSMEALEEEQKKLSDVSLLAADAEEDVANKNKDAADKNKEAADSANGIASSFEKLSDKAKDLINKYGDLYKALENVKNGGALSYEQMQDLITLYPELASKVELTADGYIIEANALADLEPALDNTVDSQIQAERDRTQAALDGARERAEIYRSELALMYGHASQAEMDKKQEAYYSVLEEIEAKQARLNELDAMGAVSAYLKGSRGSSVNSGGSVGGSGRASSSSGVNENEQTYDKEYATLKYRHDMGEISDTEFYSGIGELRDQYLEADSDKWRAANVSIHNWEESQKKSSGSSSENSSGKSGNNISITSYIPTVWDSEDEANRKMQQALGIELAGNSKYGHIMSGIERSAAVSQMSAVSSGADSTAREATLSDVVTAINELQKADENRQISFDVTLKARDLVVGRIAVADINDITKIDGKSPLILK